MNTITPLTGVTPIGSSLTDSGKGAGGFTGTPGKGELFKAIVLEARSNNTFLLDFSGKQITAFSKAPLATGQKLDLQVTATSPQIELRIVTDTQSIFQGKPVSLLGNPIDLQLLFKAIKTTTPSPFETLTQFSTKTLQTFLSFDQGKLLGNESGSLLKQLIDRLGISFEKLISQGRQNDAQSTLKSALLELAATYKGAGDLAEATNFVLNTLEMYQLAQLNLEKDGIFIFPLPFSFLKQGYLLITDHSRGQEGKEDERENRFTLNLSLEELGNLRIELLQTTTGLYLRFVSNDIEKIEFIKKYTDNLLPQLLNVPIRGLSFAVEAIDPASDLIKQIIPSDESLVDTKV